MVTSKKSDDVFLPHGSLTRVLEEGRFRMENDLIMMCCCSSEMLTWLEANCGAALRKVNRDRGTKADHVKSDECVSLFMFLVIETD